MLRFNIEENITEEKALVCSFLERMDTAKCLEIQDELFNKVRETKIPVIFNLEEVDYIASSFLSICSPLSSEILAPILAFYVVGGFDEAVKLCIDLNFYGGTGHTVSMYSNNEERIKEFASVMNAGRILVNTPSSQGAVGGIYNTLDPSFTLGCGAGGKNITTDNITARNLLNIQRIARRRINTRLEHFDQNLYFDESLDAKAIEKEFNWND